MFLLDYVTALPIGGGLGRFSAAGSGSDPLRLNVGDRVGDLPELVSCRRRALGDAYGHPLVWMHQTHSSRVQQVGPQDLAEGVSLDADGLVANIEDFTGLTPALAVQVADCMPVLLASADGHLIAAVHAGRRGFEANILEKAVELMHSLGDHGPISAAIGPAICGHCYEVPADLRDRICARFPHAWSTTSWGTPSLDLPAAAVCELERLGVSAVDVGPCTYESDQHFSYRRDSRCGRQAGIIQGSDMPAFKSPL